MATRAHLGVPECSQHAGCQDHQVGGAVGAQGRPQALADVQGLDRLERSQCATRSAPAEALAFHWRFVGTLKPPGKYLRTCFKSLSSTLVALVRFRHVCKHFWYYHVKGRDEPQTEADLTCCRLRQPFSVSAPHGQGTWGVGGWL